MKLTHHGPNGRPTAHHTEQGFILPLVALSLVAIVLLAALALDGSQAYPQRRTAQNAADAAAVAAAQAMDQAMFFGGSAGRVHDEALSVAQGNKHVDHDALRIGCTFIRYRRATEPVDPAHPATVDLGACLSTTAAVPAGAQGVRIDTYVDRSTSFGGITGSSKVTAAASAAATVQKLNTTGSPFIVCANASPALRAQGANKPVGFDLLRTNPKYPTDAQWATYTSPFTAPFVFNADGTVDLDPDKVAAVNASNGGKGMPLVGSENQVPTCGVQQGNFDGNGSYDTVSLPAWVGYTSGGGHNASAAEQVVTATPCPDPLPAGYNATAQPCDILLPLAIDARLNSVDNKWELRLVSMAVFRITGTGVGMPKYYGTIRSDIKYVSGGATSIDPVTAGAMRVVRLIE